MSIISYEETSLEDLNQEFGGKEITRVSGPYNHERTGIIDIIKRDKWGTKAVIFWDNDEEEDDMECDNDWGDDWKDDPSLEHCTDEVQLTNITNTPRWIIG